MNQPKRDESTQNQNDRKNKTVGKTGEISSKFPWNNREEFREISVKMSLAKMDL